MLLVGFLGNTVFISLYLRPRIAAAKAGMLNFYWMFLALITGVYTFGLVGIIIGPILIGVLKAVFESVVQPVPLTELADTFDPVDRGARSTG
jgi:predicted PurR-regulated permease PerM